MSQLGPNPCLDTEPSPRAAEVWSSFRADITLQTAQNGRSVQPFVHECETIWHLKYLRTQCLTEPFGAIWRTVCTGRQILPKRDSKFATRVPTTVPPTL
jgi:hypothetical protein